MLFWAAVCAAGQQSVLSLFVPLFVVSHLLPLSHLPPWVALVSETSLATHLKPRFGHKHLPWPCVCTSPVLASLMLFERHSGPKVMLFLALPPCSSMEAAPVLVCVCPSLNSIWCVVCWCLCRWLSLQPTVCKQQGGSNTVWSSAPSIDCFTLTRQPYTAATLAALARLMLVGATY